MRAPTQQQILLDTNTDFLRRHARGMCAVRTRTNPARHSLSSAAPTRRARFRCHA
jgi:hypothetical protein